MSGEECLACNSLQEREKVASTYCARGWWGHRVEFVHRGKYLRYKDGLCFIFLNERRSSCLFSLEWKTNNIVKTLAGLLHILVLTIIKMFNKLNSVVKYIAKLMIHLVIQLSRPLLTFQQAYNSLHVSWDVCNCLQLVDLWDLGFTHNNRCADDFCQINLE